MRSDRRRREAEQVGDELVLMPHGRERDHETVRRSTGPMPPPDARSAGPGARDRTRHRSLRRRPRRPRRAGAGTAGGSSRTRRSHRTRSRGAPLHPSQPPRSRWRWAVGAGRTMVIWSASCRGAMATELSLQHADVDHLSPAAPLLAAVARGGASRRAAPRCTSRAPGCRRAIRSPHKWRLVDAPRSTCGEIHHM